MAVSKSESEANIQGLVDQGVPEDYIRSNTPGAKLNPNEAGKLFSAFKADPNNVFTTSNVNAATTNPATAPDDLLGIRAGIQEELGIPGLQTAFQESMKGLSEFDQSTETFQQTLEERPESINLIRGRQQEASKQASLERSGLARAAEVAQSALLAAQQEAGVQFGIREADVRNRQQLMIQFPGAGITFGDSTEKAAKKIQKFATEEEDRIRDQAKKDAFDQLYMSTFGKDRGNLSRREAGKKLGKKYKKASDYEDALNEMAIQEAELSIQKLRSDINKTSTTPEELRLTDDDFVNISGSLEGGQITADQALSQIPNEEDKIIFLGLLGELEIPEPW